MEHQQNIVELSPTDALATHVTSLEKQLLQRDVRSHRGRLENLLHHQFHEVGSSGRVFSKVEIIEALLADPEIDSVDQSTRVDLAGPRLVALSPDCVLLRYHLVGTRTRSERSSLWVKSNDQWQLYFHQGTTCARSEQLPVQHPQEKTRTDAAGPYLRRLRHGDAPQVLAAFQSSKDMTRQGEVDSLSQAQTYIDWLLKDPGKQLPLAICVDGALAGLVCASLDQTNRNAWAWYWIHANYRGRSWTSMALRSLADELFALGFQRLELGARANNPASLAVARNAGFIHEGTERGKFLIDSQRIDVLNFSRLDTDPQPAGARLEVMPEQ